MKDAVMFLQNSLHYVIKTIPTLVLVFIAYGAILEALKQFRNEDEKPYWNIYFGCMTLFALVPITLLIIVIWISVY